MQEISPAAPGVVQLVLADHEALCAELAPVLEHESLAHSDSVVEHSAEKACCGAQSGQCKLKASIYKPSSRAPSASDSLRPYCG